MKAKNKHKRIQQQQTKKQLDLEHAKLKHEKYLKSLGIVKKTKKQMEEDKKLRVAQFNKQYRESFGNFKFNEPRREWLDGSTHVRHMLDPMEHQLPEDFEDINQRRAELGLAPMEKAAQQALEEIKRKSKCVAPAYNKGAYQPVFSKEAARQIGRSTNE
jgi:hypothetical protein